MSDLFTEPDGATPLTSGKRRDLIPAHIAFRAELNEAEQENIARGQDWALGRRRDVLTEKFIKDLHRQMLGDVWRWAGRFRTSERNLGIRHFEIAVALRQLLEDTWPTKQSRGLRFPITPRGPVSPPRARGRRLASDGPASPSPSSTLHRRWDSGTGPPQRSRWREPS